MEFLLEMDFKGPIHIYIYIYRRVATQSLQIMENRETVAAQEHILLLGILYPTPYRYSPQLLTLPISSRAPKEPLLRTRDK